MAEQQQYCTFRIDGALLGVAVEEVQEILRHQPLTPIPLAPGQVTGLINIRGQIVPAIELRRCLGIEERPHELPPANVIVRTDHGPVSLLVDEIGDVLRIEADAFEAPPENLHGARRELILGVCKLSEELLSVLDASAAIAAATADIGDRLDGEAALHGAALGN